MKNKIFYLLIFTNLFAANEGIEVGKNLKGHFNNVQTNVAAPLTSNSDFKTVNGSKSFKANLTCNETIKPFLEISYSGTSDITINVSIDTDLNGSKDKIFSFDGVSGVGTNGIIKCSTNSWKNCKYFLWNISNNNLTLSETVLTNLGGPYCINSSCGSLSVNQKINVLDTIGGAISSMYQSSNSNYLITKTQNDGNKIVFYGQNYQDCTNYKEQAPSKSHDLDTTNVIASQSKDENSVYYVLNEEVKNQNTNKFDTDVKQTTVIKNSVSVKGDTSDYTFTYSGKTQNEDGSWSTRNDNAKVNIDFLNPNIKYCEIKYLEENSILFSDGQTHHSSSGDTKTWKTKIVECTGNDYSICPVDTSKGEIIKHPCGQIDNFAEATSILMAIDEAVDDFSCSLK
ncbi:hypothetical protein N5U00_08095 [Aliarcobacter butzleri]|uniref:Uncharacterized protein n=1 Tax=Aliarcobacter butzleri L352 TaxID=1447260 RepID=A0A837JDB0_9BACT|nr:hypothetical protein [Aliarcobacter butzleri]KLE06338.1 hypothetical protein AF77_02425 [Aliarcobacter butzleri L352]MCG3705820.1 hypothetical protein [Aliarcobacter butzleri]MCT7566776.1 hypothetical protein [Aliarcobacter butzleri]MCT7575288.1 hypothetical protein [Aliarcobacter butzleri]MCT7611729.1 hypothetical protein [Aliarcobacter butzleri]